MWVVMQLARWESFQIMGMSVSSKDISVHGSTGVLLTFDDYDKALEWAGGKGELVSEIREGGGSDG